MEYSLVKPMEKTSASSLLIQLTTTKSPQTGDQEVQELLIQVEEVAVEELPLQP